MPHTIDKYTVLPFKCDKSTTLLPASPLYRYPLGSILVFPEEVVKYKLNGA